jgi:hypothetical protein
VVLHAIRPLKIVHLYSGASSKQVYHLSLRSAQGFAQSLIGMMDLKLRVPSYSILSRRQKNLKLPKLPTRSNSIHLVVDSTGLRIFGEGEWRVRRFGYDKRRTWRKLHIGVDVESKKEAPEYRCTILSGQIAWSTTRICPYGSQF